MHKQNRRLRCIVILLIILAVIGLGLWANTRQQLDLSLFIIIAFAMVLMMISDASVYGNRCTGLLMGTFFTFIVLYALFMVVYGSKMAIKAPNN